MFSRSVSQFSCAKEERRNSSAYTTDTNFPSKQRLALSRNMADPRAAVVQFPQQAQNPPAPAQVQQAQNLPVPVQVQQGQNRRAQAQGQALGNLALPTEEKPEVKLFIYVSVSFALYYRSPLASVRNCWLFVNVKCYWPRSETRRSLLFANVKC